MRTVIQRVSKASVALDGQEVSSIGQGLLVLLGIEPTDTEEDIAWLTKKVVQLRLFDDAQGVMNLSVMDVDGELLIVSQFTLHAITKKGNRPSYIRAAGPDYAIPLYQKFIEAAERLMGRRVETGVFGAMMDLSLVNAGPVTIIIDSKQRDF